MILLIRLSLWTDLQFWEILILLSLQIDLIVNIMTGYWTDNNETSIIRRDELNMLNINSD